MHLLGLLEIIIQLINAQKVERLTLRNVYYITTTITFTQNIYNYTPETNHVPMVQTVATLLLLQYMARVMLFPTINPLYFTPLLSAIVGRVAQSIWRPSYGLDDPGSNPSGDEIFRLSRPALGPTQPPVQWVTCLSWG